MSLREISFRFILFPLLGLDIAVGLGHGSPNLCVPLGLTEDIEVVLGFKRAWSGYSGGGRGESPG